MKRLVLLCLLLFATSAHATVNEIIPPRNDYTASGTSTVFAYTFKLLEKTQILVLVDGLVRTVDSHYSVSGLGDSGGGSVTFLVAPAANARVSLLRNQPVQQLSIYTANEAFPATRLMTDLDKNTMVDQMQEEELRRALKFKPESIIHDITVDDPIPNSCLSWNSAGTGVVGVTCGSGGGGGGGSVPAISPGNVVFGGASSELSQDLTGKFKWDNAAKSLTVGTTPQGSLKPGNVFMGLNAPSDTTGMQTLMVQTYQGAPGLAGLVTIGDDRVGVSSWNFRGTGASNPIYGANFGVVFNTNGVANGLEIDVQNMTATGNQGQALWLNGSGVSERANAILIDTQDGTKWNRGILFKEGFIGGGATGSISTIGIHFEKSQDADFIVIQPRVGAVGNVAMKITDPAFTVNRFEVLNSGLIRGTGGLTTAAFPVYAFVDDPDSGMYQEAANTLGWSVGGLRRLTLGTTLNVWNSGSGVNQGGSINLFDNTAVHSVGFLAADTIGTSFRFKLPTTPGTTGQCISTDGASPIATLSYSACSGGGGSGTVTTTGSPVSGNLAAFSGATSITVGNLSGDVTTSGTLVTTMKATGTAGTYGQVTTDAQGRVSSGVIINDVAHGGTNVATFTTNGVLYGNAATSVLVTAQGAANTVLVANAGAPSFSTTPTVSGLTTTGQAAHVVGPFGVSSGETGEVRFLERLANGTNYVGFRASDSLAANVIWTLPTTDSTGTQCLASNGSGVLSWGACSAGSGTGISSLNGLTGTTQTFTNDTNVTMVSAGTAHAITWVSTLASTRGGTGQNTSGSTGVPSIAAGTWSVSAQLPKSLGGTGNAGGTATRVPFWGATTLDDSASLTWDNTLVLLRLGTTSTVVPSAGTTLLTVAGPGNAPKVRLEDTSTSTSAGRTALALVRTTPLAQMIDGFNVAQDFILRDQDAIDNVNARFVVERSGADNTSIFRLQTAIAGTLADRIAINALGQMFYTPTTTVGTVGLLANGTRTTELQFYTNNNTNAVALVAPATATGNHIWRLPTTFGAVGDVLTNNGAGDLSWGSSSGIAVNVRTFGAVGDGTTNDSAAVQAAIDSAKSTGRRAVYFPSGTYLLSTGVTVTDSYTTIFGDGVSSKLFATAAINMLTLSPTGGAGPYFNWVHDLTFLSSNTGTTGLLLNATTLNSGRNQFTNLFFNGTMGYGIRVTPDSDWNLFSNLTFDTPVNGIKFEGPSSGTGNVFANMTMIVSGIGIEFAGNTIVGDITISNIQFGSFATGLKFSSTAATYRSRITMMGLQFDASSGVTIDMNGYTNVTISGVSWGGSTTDSIVSTTGYIQGRSALAVATGVTLSSIPAGPVGGTVRQVCLSAANVVFTVAAGAPCS